VGPGGGAVSGGSREVLTIVAIIAWPPSLQRKECATPGRTTVCPTRRSVLDERNASPHYVRWIARNVA
jgi:hypothetical protein